MASDLRPVFFAVSSISASKSSSVTSRFSTFAISRKRYACFMRNAAAAVLEDMSDYQALRSRAFKDSSAANPTGSASAQSLPWDPLQRIQRPNIAAITLAFTSSFRLPECQSQINKLFGRTILMLLDVMEDHHWHDIPRVFYF